MSEHNPEQISRENIKCCVKSLETREPKWALEKARSAKREPPGSGAGQKRNRLLATWPSMWLGILPDIERDIQPNLVELADHLKTINGALFGGAGARE